MLLCWWLEQNVNNLHISEFWSSPLSPLSMPAAVKPRVVWRSGTWSPRLSWNYSPLNAGTCNLVKGRFFDVSVCHSSPCVMIISVLNINKDNKHSSSQSESVFMQSISHSNPRLPANSNKTINMLYDHQKQSSTFHWNQVSHSLIINPPAENSCPIATIF